MAKAIYKYPLDQGDTQEIFIHAGAEILSVQNQNGLPVLWAIVDLSAVRKFRRIYAYPTGQVPAGMPDPATLKYIGTAQFHNGQLVIHFFDGREGE